LPWSSFLEMMRGIKRVRPDIHVKAFTAVEIFFFGRLYRMSVERVLAELREAGRELDPRGPAAGRGAGPRPRRGGGAPTLRRGPREKKQKGKGRPPPGAPPKPPGP